MKGEVLLRVLAASSIPGAAECLFQCKAEDRWGVRVGSTPAARVTHANMKPRTANAAAANEPGATRPEAPLVPEDVVAAPVAEEVAVALEPEPLAEPEPVAEAPVGVAEDAG